MRVKNISSDIAYQGLDDVLINCNCASSATAIHLCKSDIHDGVCTIKKVDSGANAVTIYPFAGETIDGAASVTLTYLNDYKTLAKTDGGWAVIDAYTSDPTLILKTGTPVNAVAATGTLTLVGVVKDSQTVTIGDDVYEFAADAAQSISAGNIAVNITSKSTASQGTLTIAVNPSAGDKMTIGTTEYTFVATADFDTAGEIEIGTDAAATQANIVKAIKGTDTVNTAHALVTIADFVANAAVITAKVAGTAGDLIATTETFTAETNVFDDDTLGTTTAGVDCTAANAITLLVAAVAASDTMGVGAADGESDTIVFTADTKGAAANSIDTTTTVTGASFAKTKLEGGVDGTIGSQWEIRVDNSAIYIAVAANTINDANWEKAAIAPY